MIEFLIKYCLPVFLAFLITAAVLGTIGILISLCLDVYRGLKDRRKG
jgi:hypothetical protein